MKQTITKAAGLSVGGALLKKLSAVPERETSLTNNSIRMKLAKRESNSDAQHDLC